MKLGEAFREASGRTQGSAACCLSCKFPFHVDHVCILERISDVFAQPPTSIFSARNSAGREATGEIYGSIKYGRFCREMKKHASEVAGWW